MSKLKFIAALTCLLTAACQAPQQTELLSNEQLMEGLEDGVASETRFLMQHWGARQEFTFCSMGSSPRDRKAFGRLLCTGNVDYFIELAHAKDPVVAAYGVEGVRILRRERLPELLPMLLERREGFNVTWADLGSSHRMPELAAQALNQLGADTPRSQIARYLEIWLNRIRRTSIEAADVQVAEEFSRICGWPGLQTLDLSMDARELLPILLPLCGVPHPNFEKDKMKYIWHYKPGTVLRRVALQHWGIWPSGATFQNAEAHKQYEGTITAIKKRRLTDNPLQDSRDVTTLECLATWAAYPEPGDESALGTSLEFVLAPWRELSQADWDYLAHHRNPLVSGSVAVLLAHPYMKLGTQPPQNSRELKFWLMRFGHHYSEQPDIVDAFLAAKPELFPPTEFGNYTNTSPFIDQSVQRQWFEPQFVHTLTGMPRHWLKFAKSARRDLRWFFYRSLHRMLGCDHESWLMRDLDYFELVLQAVRQDAQGSDPMFKWLARDWLVEYLADKAKGEERPHEQLAMSYLDELARDYLHQPSFAPRCYYIVESGTNGLCRTVGRQSYGYYAEAEDLGPPSWRQFCRLIDPVTPFGDSTVADRMTPGWLTLAEMRKLESVPAAFWRELQRDFAALPK